MIDRLVEKPAVRRASALLGVDSRRRGGPIRIDVPAVADRHVDRPST